MTVRAKKINVTKQIIDDGLRYFAQITGSDRLIRLIAQETLDKYLEKNSHVFKDLCIDCDSSIHITVRDTATDDTVDDALRGLLNVICDSFMSFIGPVGRRYFIIAYTESGLQEKDFLPEWILENKEFLFEEKILED